MDQDVMESNPDIAGIERALVAIRRSQSRRTLARLAKRTQRPALPDAVLELLDAVEAAADAVTVTDVAAVLGVDQPRASRLTAQALDAGLLRRVADQTDGRRSLLALTAAGRATLDRVHAFRQQMVARATESWTAADRAALARLLTRFVADFADVTRR